MDVNKIAILILAAGSSSRLGQPKQLLKINGISLIQRAIQTALNTNSSCNVFVVLGSRAAEIKDTINGNNVNILINKNWNNGIGESIAFGVLNILSIEPETPAIITMSCDQFYQNSLLLNKLIERFIKKDVEIVASKYNNTFGIPALFSKTIFNELLALQGDKGAKRIIKNHVHSTHFIEFKNGGIDIDTIEDFKNISVNK